MKAIIGKEEHEQFFKQVMYASPVRFALGAGLMYFVISLVLDFVTGERFNVFTVASLVETLVTSMIWSCLFSLFFLPIMKMTSQKISEAAPAESMAAKGYTQYAPCSHKQSKINSIGGVLYIGRGKVCFKPHKFNVKASLIEWHMEAGEVLEASFERQRVPLMARIMYKTIPDCLVLSSKGRRLALIAARPEKVLETLKAEGLVL